jgi:uncharacterized membrane protein YkoI
MKTKQTMLLLTLASLGCTMASVAMAADFDTIEAIDRAMKAPVSLARAVSIATKHTPGRVVSAEVEDSSPMSAEVKVSTPDGVHKVMVNLSNGQVVSDSGGSMAAKAFKYSYKYDLLGQMKVSLMEALALAEDKTNGRAVKAKFTTERGAHVYEIETVAQHAYNELDVDANNKEVLESKYRKIR